MTVFAFGGMKPMENTLYSASQSKENKPHTQALGVKNLRWNNALWSALSQNKSCIAGLHFPKVKAPIHEVA